MNHTRAFAHREVTNAVQFQTKSFETIAIRTPFKANLVQSLETLLRQTESGSRLAVVRVAKVDGATAPVSSLTGALQLGVLVPLQKRHRGPRKS